MYTTSHVSLADGLAVPMVGSNAFVTAQPLVDKTVAVRLVILLSLTIINTGNTKNFHEILTIQ